MLIDCVECGGQVSTKAKACMKCGAAPMIKCLECGNYGSFGAGVCEYCGVEADSEPKVTSRKKAIPRQRKPPPPPPPIAEHVDFYQASYNANCPDCKRLFYVKGETLRKGSAFRCPYSDTKCRKHMFFRFSIRRNKDEIIVYRILGDYFSYYGRISVLSYWKSVLIALIPILVVGMICKFLFPPLYPIILFLALNPLYIKRLNDLNIHVACFIFPLISAVCMSINTWLFPSMMRGEQYPFLQIVTVLSLLGSLVVGIMVAFVPGKKKMNRFGPAANKTKVEWF